MLHNSCTLYVNGAPYFYITEYDSNTYNEHAVGGKDFARIVASISSRGVRATVNRRATKLQHVI